MKRLLSNEVVEKVKEMIVDGYATRSISDIMWVKYKTHVSVMVINSIKYLKTYYDVRQDLNQLIIEKNVISDKIDRQKISEIKWAISNNFSETEIILVYHISKKMLNEIRYGYFPYCLIATEYNDILAKTLRRKKTVNIDKKIVLQIKEEFVNSKGAVSMTSLAEKYKINNATVSCILSLKFYKDIGVVFNSRIISIKNQKKSNANKKKTLNNKIQLMRSWKKKEQQKIQEINVEIKRLAASVLKVS